MFANLRSTNHRLLTQSAVFVLLLPGAACQHAEVMKEEATMKLELTSPAFKDGQPIPARYTCDGQDVSPALKWKGAPADAKSFALICDDPDAPAGTWVHWVLFDLPATTTELPEAVPPSASTPQGARQGTNDFGRLGYGGPCPPPGKAHRYFFKLYALDSQLNLGPNARKKDVENAMRGHILGEGRLLGTYRR